MWTGLCFVSVTSRRQERTNGVPNQIADRSIPMNRMIKLKECNLLKCKLSFKKLRIKYDSAFRTCYPLPSIRLWQENKSENYEGQ